MAEAKKRGPLFWVILGVVLLVLLLGVVIVSVGYFRNQQGAVAISTSNPGYAALKIMILNSPDVEVIREEPEKMQILTRDKKTGEYFLVRADDETKSITRVPVPADQVK